MRGRRKRQRAQEELRKQRLAHLAGLVYYDKGLDMYFVLTHETTASRTVWYVEGPAKQFSLCAVVNGQVTTHMSIREDDLDIRILNGEIEVVNDEARIAEAMLLGVL